MVLYAAAVRGVKPSIIGTHPRTERCDSDARYEPSQARRKEYGTIKEITHATSVKRIDAVKVRTQPIILDPPRTNRGSAARPLYIDDSSISSLSYTPIINGSVTAAA